MVSAFAAGMLRDQERAVEVSEATTTDTALWAAARALASNSGFLQSATTNQLKDDVQIFPKLNLPNRLVVIGAALQDSLIVDKALSHPAKIPLSPQTLICSIRNIMRALQISAAGLAVYGLYGLIAKLKNPHHWTTTDTHGAAYFSLLFLLAVLFLSIWVGRRRGSALIANLVGTALAAVVALPAVLGVAVLPGILVLALTGDLSTAGYNFVLAYITTWPIAIVSLIAIGPPPTVRDWLIPQIPLIKIGVVAIRRYDWHRRQEGGEPRNNSPAMAATCNRAEHYHATP